MEEKVIIESQNYDAKKVSAKIFGAGVGVFILFNLYYFVTIYHDYKMWHPYYSPAKHVVETINFYFSESYYIWPFIPLGCFCLFAIYFYLWSKSFKLTVTDKRVYGNAAFGQRVDLPLDSISEVGVKIFKGIEVTTASGGIKFALIKNRDECFECISKLLIERQNKTINVVAQSVEKQPVNSANELKELKELLDAGIITQEEFDAKKKQVLGI